LQDGTGAIVIPPTAACYSTHVHTYLVSPPCQSRIDISVLASPPSTRNLSIILANIGLTMPLDHRRQPDEDAACGDVAEDVSDDSD
jgi:hypothetical protein